MNDPDGPEQRQADLDEKSEYEYDELDRMERQGDFDAEEALLDVAQAKMMNWALDRVFGSPVSVLADRIDMARMREKDKS